MENILIIGGGNAGYISALMLKKSFPSKNIGVIYSKKVGTIGVGESSSEHIADFCKYVGINKLNFILKAKSTSWSLEDIEDEPNGNPITVHNFTELVFNIFLTLFNHDGLIQTE